MDRRRLDEAMREDLEYVDIATLTKIKMWYYNSMFYLDINSFSQYDKLRLGDKSVNHSSWQ